MNLYVKFCHFIWGAKIKGSEIRDFYPRGAKIKGKKKGERKFEADEI